MWMSEISEKGEKEPPVWGDRHVRYIVPYMATLVYFVFIFKKKKKKWKG